MFRIIAALVALVGFSPCCLAQEPTSAIEPAATNAADAATEPESERVIVPGTPSRKMIYDFYRQLTSNDFCPRGFLAPAGYSCAEVTYDVLSADGKHLGRCNIPIFRMYANNFEYSAFTYDRLDCADKTPANRNLAAVPLEQLFNPRTKDGTVFRKISVMGIDQAKELCNVSSDVCALKLFDRERELTFCAKQYLWPVGPTPRICNPLR